ncbi:hypothetical protein C8A00DRAFT_18730 [Chaetomidium leptoderma]|uniref:DUF1772-domain-containing protein n=1 Tax=Chaetomidium leptoderma TaxID=669021 RepID=A0AAN6ZSS6_9PEZI|nr:hypothetical protein C8A00DRAFT_18730 [Chaetomidium leptoderma]
MALPTLTAVAQWASIAMPTLYAGITFQYSLTMHHLARTSPTPKLLARQWLALYQQGPRWVPPLINTAVLSNLFLAFYAVQTASQKYLHLLAAALSFSILPMTFVYFEPGINGACKWKAGLLLSREDGFEMAEGGMNNRIGVSVGRHSANEGARRWAEGVEMEALVVAWAGRNHGRWVLGVVAGVVSFWASRGG